MNDFMREFIKAAKEDVDGFPAVIFIFLCLAIAVVSCLFSMLYSPLFILLIPIFILYVAYLTVKIKD